MALYKLTGRKPVASVNIRVPAEIYDRIRDTAERGKLATMGEAATMFYNELIALTISQQNKIEDLKKEIEELTKRNKKLEEDLEDDAREILRDSQKHERK